MTRDTRKTCIAWRHVIVRNTDSRIILSHCLPIGVPEVYEVCPVPKPVLTELKDVCECDDPEIAKFTTKAIVVQRQNKIHEAQSRNPPACGCSVVPLIEPVSKGAKKSIRRVELLR